MDAPYIGIHEVQEYCSRKVTVRGWMQYKRTSGGIWFLLVRDGTGLIQCVVSESDVSESVFQACQNVTRESSLTITGCIRAEQRAPGGYEIRIRDICIHQLAKGFPIDRIESIASLMDLRHLWIRSDRQSAILKVRNEIIRATQYYFDEWDIRIDTPILGLNSVQIISPVFDIDYFGNKAYLSSNGTFYLEAAVMAFGKVCHIGPAFRAETAISHDHLTEFWLIEFETAYAELDDIIPLVEEYIRFLIRSVLTNVVDSLKVLKRDTNLSEISDIAFSRIHFEEAKMLVTKKEAITEPDSELKSSEIQVITEMKNGPVFIDRLPVCKKRFHIKQTKDQTAKTLGFELYVPGSMGKIASGGQRETDYDILSERIQNYKIPIDLFPWYLDLRKYGSVTHSGFSVCLEKLVAWICGIKHIRETIPFPRMKHRLAP